MPPADGNGNDDAAACASSSSARSVGVCACCVVWEVTRGPHASERVAFAASQASPTPHATLAIGRKASCWLRLRKDLEVSGLHAELQVAYTDHGNSDESLALVLRDANSTNGTRVNGDVLASGATRPVLDQDLIQFGRTTVRVRLGDTACPRARQDDAKVALAIANEPEDEPVVVVAVSSSSRVKDQAEKAEIEEQAEDTRVVHTEEAIDENAENAFETPEKAPPVSATASLVSSSSALASSSSSALLDMCMVCGQALAAWSVLEQQLHVNACLDRKTDMPTLPTFPTFPTQPTQPTPTLPPANGKKRKRQATLTKSRGNADDEALRVALALSESLADPEQHVDMELALVRGELSQLDAQLKKLSKKRATLLKKLTKLEKTKRKVHKGVVLAPAATRALLDVARALRVVFPEAREAVGHLKRTRRQNDATARLLLRPGVARLMARYCAVEDVELDERQTYVTMWQRSAQCDWRPYRGGGEERDGDAGSDEDEENDALYVTRLLQRLQAREQAIAAVAQTSTPGEAMGCEEVVLDQQVDADLDAKKGLESTATSTASDAVVPDVVKRVFPNWQENLAFLRTQSVPDLKDALRQMHQMRADAVAETEGKEDSVGGDSKVDEVAACAFFENEMTHLIATKERSSNDDVEIVVLVDSQDEDDRDERDRGMSTEWQEPVTSGPPSVLSIDDSSDEDIPVATTSPPSVDPPTALREESASDAMDDESDGVDDTVHLESRVANAWSHASTGHDIDTSNDTNAAATVPVSVTVAMAHTTNTEPMTDAAKTAQLETQLLMALKANAKLYESVLLLQPLDLPQLLRYMRDDAGVKCPKKVLIKFCDRHGITFKSS